MNNPAYGFTVMLAEQAPVYGPAVDYIVSDDGVLYATTDHGSHWRCLCMVDAIAFLLDNGFAQAAESLASSKAEWTHREKVGSPPG
jgi:hypothetical protein